MTERRRLCFLTGATGSLGQAVLEAWTGAPTGDVLVAGARRPEQLAKWAARGVEARPFDYGDEDVMRRALAGVDTVLVIPSKSPNLARVGEHQRVLDAARASGVRRVVAMTLQGTSLDSLNILAPYFTYAETANRLSGLEWVNLRMGLYLDPVVAWVPQVAEWGRLPYPIARGRIAYITRRDIARAAVGALRRPELTNQTFTLTGPYALSMPELAAAISEATGKPIRFDRVSDAEFLEICKATESSFVSEVLISLYHAVDAGEFELVTDHVQRLSGTPPAQPRDVLRGRAE